MRYHSMRQRRKKIWGHAVELRGYQSKAVDACQAAFRAMGADGKFSCRNMILVSFADTCSIGSVR